MLLPSGTSTVEGVLVSLGQTYVITRVSKYVFEKLNENCGPKGFRAWKSQKMDVFIQNMIRYFQLIYVLLPTYQ